MNFTEPHLLIGIWIWMLEVVYKFLCIILHCVLLIYGRMIPTLEVHGIWRPGSVFPNPSLSRLLDCSPSFPSTGGPTGFSSCSILVPSVKATAQSSAVFGIPPASSPSASNCSCSPLHSTPCCLIIDEAAVLRSLWSPPSTKPAPLYLCEALLVSIAAPVRENQNELFNSRKTLRCRMPYWAILTIQYNIDPKLCCWVCIIIASSN